MINDSESVSLLLLTLLVFVDKHTDDDDYYNGNDVKPIHNIVIFIVTAAKVQKNSP